MGVTNKILLAIPTDGGLHARTSACAALLAQRPDTDYITVTGRPADYARNGAVRLFGENPEYTHLFFLDSDTEPPLDVIDRLLAVDSPLAVGCYALLMPEGLRWALSIRGDDGRYRLLKELPYPDRPFNVDAAGAGCLLIRRDVFDKVKWPWFKWVEHADGAQMSEDVYFFDQCRAAGIPLVCDPRVRCYHYKTVDITRLMKG